MEMKRYTVKWISLLMSLLICITSLPLTAGAEADAGGLAAAILEEQAAKQTDPWVLAILRAGAKDAALQDGNLVFTLRSYTPDLKSMGSYTMTLEEINEEIRLARLEGKERLARQNAEEQQ